MYTEQKLSNGLRVLISPQEGTKACTLLILVGAGSRYEAEHERGTAHFLEHMFFKGGARYKNAKEVSEAIDGVGGDFNAFTGKEYVGYYVKVAAEQKKIAFDVLSDMLLNATFDPTEIDKERGVILEEMNMYEDMPTYKVGWDFEELLFGNHPMALDQIGTPELINSITQEDFQKYKNELYTPENTVIIATGDVQQDEIMKLIDQYFIFSNTSKKRTPTPFNWSETETLFLRNKNTEQAHLVMGFPGLDHFDADKYAESILSVILGGGMSSRMFLRVREEKGLCYSIGTSTDRYTDCGVFSTRAGVAIPRVLEAVEAIAKEYHEIAQNGILETELIKAKNYLKGKITLRMEDCEEIAGFLGTQAVLHRPIKTLDEYFESIDAVTKEQVDLVAKRILDPKKLRLSIIGPFEGKEEELKNAMNIF